MVSKVSPFQGEGLLLFIIAQWIVDTLAHFGISSSVSGPVTVHGYFRHIFVSGNNSGCNNKGAQMCRAPHGAGYCRLVVKAHLYKYPAICTVLQLLQYCADSGIFDTCRPMLKRCAVQLDICMYLG